jgi:2-dehydro-3-deoxyphosphogluconate aldolase/(4S)-4-hydroxy-2-oxoglutarate aldolase
MTLADRTRLLLDPGIIAIIRARSASQVPQVCEALLAGGILAIEVTYTTPNALEAIREAARQFGQRALIGVGTTLNAGMTHAAIEAGAQFVVSPILRPEIAEAAHQAECPVMLGAYTPTEAQLAHEAGADFVKIFPADTLGPAYIKALRAPLPHLRCIPTGGVDLHTAADFLKAGCPALGVGSSLVSAAILNDNDWPELTRRAKAFVEIVRQVRATA